MLTQKQQKAIKRRKDYIKRRNIIHNIPKAARKAAATLVETKVLTDDQKKIAKSFAKAGHNLQTLPTPKKYARQGHQRSR